MVQRKSVSVWENFSVCFDWLFWEVTCIVVSQILGVVRRKEWTERAKARQRMWWRFRTGKSISKSCEGKGTEEASYHRKGGHQFSDSKLQRGSRSTCLTCFPCASALRRFGSCRPKPSLELSKGIGRTSMCKHYVPICCVGYTIHRGGLAGELSFILFCE